MKKNNKVIIISILFLFIGIFVGFVFHEIYELYMQKNEIREELKSLDDKEKEMKKYLDNLSFEQREQILNDLGMEDVPWTVFTYVSTLSPKERETLEETIDQLSDPEYVKKYVKEYVKEKNLYSKDGEFIIGIPEKW